MLILQGELDYRVPYGQGLSLYGILQSIGVPSRLGIFINENHWALSLQNSIYWIYEMQSWRARYIGGTPMARPVFDEVRTGKWLRKQRTVPRARVDPATYRLGGGRSIH